MATKFNEEDESPELTEQGKPRPGLRPETAQDNDAIADELMRATNVGRNQARLDRIAEIARNSELSRMDTSHGGHPEFTEEELAALDEEETPEESVAEAASEGQEEAAPEPDQPKKFRIRVDGEDIELTQDELIARASKVTAADKYLEDAKR